MKIAVDATQMKQIERETIEGAGLPSLVLMERAALALTDAVQKKATELQTICPVRIGILCGNGNNGGDGVACARHLFLAGYDVKGRSPEGGNGNLVQYSCLENPTDRGAWRAIVHRVTKSRI